MHADDRHIIPCNAKAVHETACCVRMGLGHGGFEIRKGLGLETFSIREMGQKIAAQRVRIVKCTRRAEHDVIESVCRQYCHVNPIH